MVLISQVKLDFGVDIGSRMLSVHARRLNAPQVCYGNKSALIPELADWNMTNKYFFRCVPNTNWSRLDLSGKAIPEKAWSSFEDALKLCGMDQTTAHPNGPFRSILLGNGDDAENDRSIERTMREIATLGVQILLVVLPFKSTTIYARVKFWADLKFGMV